MKTTLALALCAAAFATSTAHAAGYQSKAMPVTLPKDAYARKWHGSGSNALIIPTYDQRNAPNHIAVNGREYRRDSFNYTQSGQRTFMAYTETADSSMRNRQAEYAKRDAQNRRNSW